MMYKRICAIIGLVMLVFLNVYIGYSLMNPQWSPPLDGNVLYAVYVGYIIVMGLCFFIALRKKGK